MSVLVYAAGRADIPPHTMSDRFRHDVAYFMQIPAEGGGELPTGEFLIDLAQARAWFEDGVISLVSPLDSQNRTEVEISEEQEGWLEWLLAHQVNHIRLV